MSMYLLTFRSKYNIELIFEFELKCIKPENLFDNSNFVSGGIFQLWKEPKE